MTDASTLEGLRRRTVKVAHPLARYHDDPVAFVHDVIEWPEDQAPAAYQDEILAELLEHEREAVRGPHGLGKTTLASFAILWFATTREAAGEDWKIATTASAWAQLKEFLWPEIHKWARRLRWAKIGTDPWNERDELQTLGLQLRHGHAFSASPVEPARIEGAHADQILYVYDEAKTIPAALFDATEGAFSGAGPDTGRKAYALAISTPGEPNGRFYDIHRQAPGTAHWHPRHVTIDEALGAGRISAKWLEDMAPFQGTAMYANRVEGEFASSDEDGVIPLGWVEAAQLRWREAYPKGWVEPVTDLDIVGVDCSGTGKDRTVLARRYGRVIGALERPRKATGTDFGDEEQATASRLEALLAFHPSGRAIVDALGLGGGVIAMARQTIPRYRVLAFVASGATSRRDRNREFGFTNVRSAAWWNLREMLDPDHGAELALPPDDLLTGDLTAPHWRLMAGGKIQVESKDEIRKRLGRSTDSGDAVVQACWSPVEPAHSATAAGMRIPTMTGNVR